MANAEDILFVQNNINNPAKLDEILRLVDEGKIDPNEWLFYGKNLLQLAAQMGNFSLVKTLCENPHVDVNKKTEDGFPLLVLLAQVYQDKHEEILSFLLEKTKIDPNATNAAGYAAGGWADRCGNYACMHKLLSHERKNSYGHKAYNIKMTCLRFGLGDPDNNDLVIKVNSTKLPTLFQNGIRPEGFCAAATVPSLQASFDAFTKDGAVLAQLSEQEQAILIEANTNMQNYSIFQKDGLTIPDTSSIYKDYVNGKTITIHGEASEHAASVVARAASKEDNDNIIYRCNKGFKKHPDYSIVKYKATDKEQLDEHFIGRLLKCVDPTEVLSLKQLEGINGKAQYVGNCTVASPKKSIHAMIYDVVTQKYPNLDEEQQKIMAKTLYKKWTAWDRARQINLLIESCGDVPEIFVSLLKNILSDTARFSLRHAELAKALCEHIPQDLLKAEFPSFPYGFFNAIEKLSIGEHEQTNAKQFIKKHKKKYVTFMKDINLPHDKSSLEQCDLLLAATTGNIDKMKEILDGPQKDYLLATPTRKLTCLHLCVLWNNKECLQMLLSKYPELINTPDANNFTPLHLAVYFGNAELTAFLLENGADPTLHAGKQKQLSLHMLVERLQEIDPSAASIIENLLSKDSKNKMKA